MMNFHLNAVTNLVLRLGPVAQRWELSLARAVFLHRLGEIRDRKPENQSYRASGLTLLTATDALLGEHKKYWGSVSYAAIAGPFPSL